MVPEGSATAERKRNTSVSETIHETRAVRWQARDDASRRRLIAEHVGRSVQSETARARRRTNCIFDSPNCGEVSAAMRPVDLATPPSPLCFASRSRAAACLFGFFFLSNGMLVQNASAQNCKNAET